MSFKSSQCQNGYVAIVTAAIAVVILGTVTFMLADSAVLGRYDTLLARQKLASRYLAESCLEVARLRLVQNSNYTGSETVSIGESSCTIETVTTVSDSSGTQKMIPASAAMGRARTKLILTVRAPSLTTVSLREVVE